MPYWNRARKVLGLLRMAKVGDVSTPYFVAGVIGWGCFPNSN